MTSDPETSTLPTWSPNPDPSVHVYSPDFVNFVHIFFSNCASCKGSIILRPTPGFSSSDHFLTHTSSFYFSCRAASHRVGKIISPPSGLGSGVKNSNTASTQASLPSMSAAVPQSGVWSSTSTFLFRFLCEILCRTFTCDDLKQLEHAFNLFW